MQYIRNYIIVILLVGIVLVVGLKLVWYYFMVQLYQPEWFILIAGMVFLLAGFWVSREWFHSHKTSHPGIDTRIDALAAQEKFGLSKAETEVLELMVSGKSNMEIADSRHVSVNTVKTHIGNIYQKLDVKNRIQLLTRLQETV